MKKVVLKKIESFSLLKEVMSEQRDNLIGLSFYEERESNFLTSLDLIESYSVPSRYAEARSQQKFDLNRVLLIERLAVMCRRIVSYSIFKNDVALRVDIDVAASKMKRMHKAALLGFAHGVIDRANQILNSDANSPISIDEVQEVVQIVASIEQVKEVRKSSQSKRKNFMRSLSELYANVNNSYAQLYATFAELKHTNPTLYAQLITDTRVPVVRRKLSLIGVVADAKSTLPITNVRLSIRKMVEEAGGELKPSKTELKKRSAAKGGFLIRTLSEGRYQLTASKLGYATVNLEFNVLNAETSHVSVKLEAS